MKTLTLKTLVAAAVATLSVHAFAESVEASYEGGITKQPFHIHSDMPEAVRSEIRHGRIPELQVRGDYDDLRVRCDRLREKLTFVRDQSIYQCKIKGDCAKAAAKLSAELGKFAAEFNATGDESASFNAHTAIALQAASELSQTFLQAIAQNAPHLYPGAVGGVEYNFVVKLTQFVLDVNKDLDSEFLLKDYETCHHWHCTEDVDVAWKSKMGSMTKRLMGVYEETKASMASDVVNLIMGAQVAQTSADFLARSPFRREYARDAVILEDAAQGAQDVLLATDVSAQDVVWALHTLNESVRYALETVKDYEEQIIVRTVDAQ
jgi:hypothetical protein